jgi:hypothetical protein
MKATSMKQIIESGRLKRYIDPRFIEALNHPLRAHVIAICNERIASGTQIGEEIGADVSLFYKHIQKLEALGCIERVDTRQRRGWKEHFFRATSTLFFDSPGWGITPRSLKDDISLNNLQSTFDEAAGAARAGVLNTRDDEHTSWTPGRFDQQAWSEAADVLDDALAQIRAILQKGAERLAERDEVGTPATVAMFGFKTDASDRAAE